MTGRPQHARALAVVAMAAASVACSSSSAPPAAESSKPPPAAAAAKAAYFTPDPATAATLTGKVSYRGPRLRLQKLRIDEDAGCQQLNRSGLLEETVIVGAGGALANVFIHVKSGLEGKQFAPPPPEAMVTVDQNHCRFSPHVFGVRVGQMIRVTNSDPLTHNIHPQPKQNREWNQSQEPGAPPLERRFVRPELYVRVKCNVHSWMRAYVSALEHPYFTVTGADGSFEIPQLPPGEYTIEAWQEKFGVQEQRIKVEPSSRPSITFTFPGAAKTL